MGLFSYKSIIFDGVNEHATIGDVLGFEYNEACSFSVWFKTVNTVDNQVLIAKQTGATSWQGYIFYMTASGALRIDWNNNSATANIVAGQTDASGWNDGIWRHACLTKGVSASASSFVFYVDGVVMPWTATFDALSATILTTAELQIGARDVAGNENYFDGNLDDIAIYDKELTLLEVKEIYGASEPNNLSILGSYSNCVAWWRMGDGDIFPTLIDSTGSYNGTMINMESGDIVEDTPAGVLSVEVGGTETITTRYKMRARDSGAVPPGYVTWISSDEPDYLGTEYSSGTPTPIGPMIVGSAIKIDEWS